MMPKRVRQFYVNVTDKMSKSDIEYVKDRLDDNEGNLFFKLLKSEQKHSVRIARDIEAIIENDEVDDEEITYNKDKLIKIALLHDVGKARKKLNVIDKSIIVILAKITDHKLKNVKFSKKVQCYYNHSEYGYEILKDIVDDERMLYIIRNHHSELDDKMINFFQIIDDKN